MYNTACIEKLRVKNRGSENDGIILKNYWKWVLMHQECYFSKYYMCHGFGQPKYDVPMDIFCI